MRSRTWPTLALAVLLVALIGASAAFAGKLPPPVRCTKSKCTVTTLLAVSGTPPGNGGEYPVTVAGRISAPALGKVCQGNRKIEVGLTWDLSATQEGVKSKIVTTTASGKFSATFEFVVPPPNPKFPGRAYSTSGAAEYAGRHYKGKPVLCNSSKYHEGTPWTHTEWQFPYE